MTSKIAKIVWAEDDPADRVLIKRAMRQAKVTINPKFFDDGFDLLQYVKNEGEYTDRRIAPRPDMILLDLNMPRLDGRRVLGVLAEDHDLRRIPVIVVTTSGDPVDVMSSYDLGANSYITKPQTFDELVETVKTIEDYWLRLCMLPMA